MISIFNRLSVKEGAAGKIAKQFANSWGNAQGSRTSSRWRSCTPTVSCS